MLLHASDADPTGTIQWLKARPHLARHHHVRLSHSKVRLDCLCQMAPRRPNPSGICKSSRAASREHYRCQGKSCCRAQLHFTVQSDTVFTQLY